MKLKNILLFSFACLCLASFDANAGGNPVMRTLERIDGFFQCNKTKLMLGNCAAASGVAAYLLYDKYYSKKNNSLKQTMYKNRKLISGSFAVAGGVASYLYAKSNPKIAMVASMLMMLGIRVSGLCRLDMICKTISGGVTMKNISDSRALATIFGGCLSGLFGKSLCSKYEFSDDLIITLLSLNILGLLKYLKDPISN